MSKDGVPRPSRSVVEEFSDIAAHVHSTEDYEQSLHRITDAAVLAVTGCDAASLSLLEESVPVSHAWAPARFNTLEDVKAKGGLICGSTGSGPWTPRWRSRSSPTFPAASARPTDSG